VKNLIFLNNFVMDSNKFKLISASGGNERQKKALTSVPFRDIQWEEMEAMQMEVRNNRRKLKVVLQIYDESETGTRPLADVEVIVKADGKKLKSGLVTDEFGILDKQFFIPKKASRLVFGVAYTTRVFIKKVEEIITRDFDEEKREEERKEAEKKQKAEEKRKEMEKKREELKREEEVAKKRKAEESKRRKEAAERKRKAEEERKKKEEVAKKRKVEENKKTQEEEEKKNVQLEKERKAQEEKEGTVVWEKFCHCRKENELDLSRTDISVRELEVLLRFDLGTTVLYLHNSRIGDEHVRVVANSPSLKNLTKLQLGGNSGISGNAVNYLVSSEYLKNLNFLGLNYTNIGLAGLKILVESAFLLQLNELKLKKCNICSAGMDALARSQYARNLTVLALGGNRKIDGKIYSFVNSRCLGNLEKLDLSDTGISGYSAGSLVSSSCFGSLVEVNISHNLQCVVGSTLCSENLGGFEIKEDPDETYGKLLYLRKKSESGAVSEKPAESKPDSGKSWLSSAVEWLQKED